jgi:hypothetical protein
MNNRPIDNPKLQRALNEVKQVFARYGLAGTCMLVSEDEAAFTYAMHAPWSAIRYDATTPLGWRLRAKSQEDGPALTHKRIEGAAHTVCQLADFGAQTMDWMEQVKTLMRQAGIDFDHTPFGGQPLPSISGVNLAGKPPHTQGDAP